VKTVPIMLERIIDNLLTNAAKYTERGSIIVEVGGTPGFFLLKISDTGRGIGPERLEQVLRSGGPDPNPPVGGSRGAGLSIVARLLDQLGGRLEIMSEPGEGTTVWMYLPCEGEARDGGDALLDDRSDAIEHVLRRVVKIRAKPRQGSKDHAGPE
jgi:signal transduction histidine kinase